MPGLKFSIPLGPAHESYSRMIFFIQVAVTLYVILLGRCIRTNLGIVVIKQIIVVIKHSIRNNKGNKLKQKIWEVLFVQQKVLALFIFCQIVPTNKIALSKLKESWAWLGSQLQLWYKNKCKKEFFKDTLLNKCTALSWSLEVSWRKAKMQKSKKCKDAGSAVFLLDLIRWNASLLVFAEYPEQKVTSFSCPIIFLEPYQMVTGEGGFLPFKGSLISDNLTPPWQWPESLLVAALLIVVLAQLRHDVGELLMMKTMMMMEVKFWQKNVKLTHNSTPKLMML